MCLEEWGWSVCDLCVYLCVLEEWQDSCVRGRGVYVCVIACVFV